MQLQASIPSIDDDQGVNNETVNVTFWAAVNDQVGLSHILATALPRARRWLLTLNKGSWYS